MLAGRRSGSNWFWNASMPVRSALYSCSHSLLVRIELIAASVGVAQYVGMILPSPVGVPVLSGVGVCPGLQVDLVVDHVWP